MKNHINKYNFLASNVLTETMISTGQKKKNLSLTNYKYKFVKLKFLFSCMK